MSLLVGTSTNVQEIEASSCYFLQLIIVNHGTLESIILQKYPTNSKI